MKKLVAYKLMISCIFGFSLGSLANFGINHDGPKGLIITFAAIAFVAYFARLILEIESRYIDRRERSSDRYDRYID